MESAGPSSTSDADSSPNPRPKFPPNSSSLALSSSLLSSPWSLSTCLAMGRIVVADTAVCDALDDEEDGLLDDAPL